ncbi:MAG: hypothetical protein WCG23_02765 [bacterium]
MTNAVGQKPITEADFKLKAGIYQVDGPAAQEAGGKKDQVLLFNINKDGKKVEGQRVTDPRKDIPLYHSFGDKAGSPYGKEVYYPADSSDTNQALGVKFDNHKLVEASKELQMTELTTTTTNPVKEFFQDIFK